MSSRAHKGWFFSVLLAGGVAHATVAAEEPAVGDLVEAMPELPRQAILRFARTDLEEWRYLRTRESEEGVLVDRHDPTLPGAEHWQLVSIDGREPTEEERRDYEKDRADHSSRDERAQAEKIAAMLEPGSVRPLEPGGGEQRFAYRMRSPDGEHERVFRAMEGELVIVDDASEPWVRTVHVWNHDTFRPILGVRIDEARLRFDFALQDGWILPTAVEARWSGAFLMLKDIDRRLRFSLGDFELLEDPRTLELASAP